MARSILQNGRGLALAVVLAMLAIAPGCGGGDGGGTPPAPSGAQAQETPQKPEDPSDLIAVKVAAVETAPISSLYTTSSTLRADKQATVIARTRGVIRRLAVEEGDVVASGQVLAVLEDDEQRIEVDRTRTALEIEEQEYSRGNDDAPTEIAGALGRWDMRRGNIFLLGRYFYGRGLRRRDGACFALVF